MKAAKLFNMNNLGLLFLASAFVISLVRVLVLTRESTGGPDQKIITLVHWQLEAGYRNSLDKAMAEYNNLPKVKAAHVTVRQMGVPERVYGQFLNIHLMSGTAPDICEKGKASMAQGDFTGRFFVPLSSYVTQPNPYNNDQTLPKDMDPQLKGALEHGPWRDTLVDGMQGGWDDKLQDFYAIPSSLFGAIRLFYNKRMMAEAKQMIRDALAVDPQPDWFDKVILRTGADGRQTGYVTINEEFRQWAASDQVPDTLGRLLVVCETIRQMSNQPGKSKLVPIAGSSYSSGMFNSQFIVPFTYSMSEALDYNGDSSVTGIESYAGYQRGVWSFDDPRVRGYWDCVRTICKQYPVGFLGLDREQAMRRFTEKNACMIASGAWDAGGIFLQAEGELVGPNTVIRPDDEVTEVDGRKRLNHKFDVGIMMFPMPAHDERWGDVTRNLRITEATTTAGARYSLFQRSPNKEWAIDFLRYLTSYQVNQWFNRGADWIPCVIGTTPVKQMQPFTPEANGVFSGARLEFTANGANFWTVMVGQMWLYELGEIDYAAFIKRITDAMADQRTGLMRFWYDSWDKDRAAARNQDRMLAVYTMRVMTDPSDAAMDKYKRGLLASVTANNGNNIKQMWNAQFPDKPFPKF